jgi:thermostable 8-oxoguanine DNA glycosylase
MISNIKNKLLLHLQESMQNSLDRFKSLYYQKGLEYLEKSERIVLLLNKIDNKYNFENFHNEVIFQKIQSIQNEIDTFLIDMKQETRDEFIYFQVNTKLKKYLAGGKFN